MIKNILILLCLFSLSLGTAIKGKVYDENNGTPIKLELNLIQNYLNNFKKVNILIDDIRLFNNKFQNYPNKNYIIEWSNKNNLSWEIEQDIFICKKY